MSSLTIFMHVLVADIETSEDIILCSRVKTLVNIHIAKLAQQVVGCLSPIAWA